MRAVKLSLAACGLSTVCLGLVIANAIFAPLPTKAPPQKADWTPVVFKNSY